MSLHSATSTLTRSKSLRVPSKSSVTAPTSASTPSFTSTHIPSTTSHVSLFLTNLHLLNLDLEPDWPGITQETILTKDGHKKRIQCVEWALYRLFVLWDEEEARNKLKPFYPPLDQVQSINLRAALLRLLEHAKRNGVLGRDAVIRKTMLDECKGERFEEVLAVFSSAVLKKLEAERLLNAGPGYIPTFAEKISVENWGYTGERTELNGLLLAHKAGLRKILQKKNAARSRYQDFNQLLVLKERNIARRREQIKHASEHNQGTNIPTKVKQQVRQTLQTNWTGDENWLETVLYEDTGSHVNGLLTSSFDDVWTGVQEGKLSDIEQKTAGLLEQLDQRVRLQRSRLEKWQGFRTKMFGGRLSKPRNETEKEARKIQRIDLGFNTHQQLRPGIDSYEVATESRMPAPPPEYAQLLDAMKAEIENVGKPQLHNLSKLASERTATHQRAISLPVPTTVPEDISDLSEWEDEPEEEIKAEGAAPGPPKITHAKALSSQISQLRPQNKRTVIRHPSKHEDGRAHTVTPTTDTSAESEKPNTSSETSLDDVNKAPKVQVDPTLSPDRSPMQQPVSKKEGRMEQRITVSPPPVGSPIQQVSPTQAMADQILASMSNASPSPMKKPRHMLSLAERTRMSMSRTQTLDEEDELDTSLLMPTPNPSRHVSASSQPEGEGDDLVARTRKSMANYEIARAKAQEERRRSQSNELKKNKMLHRQSSYFPSVEEEPSMLADQSIVDELLETGVDDMEAIFRSRPKMRTSPAPSPHRQWREDIDVEDDE